MDAGNGRFNRHNQMCEMAFGAMRNMIKYRSHQCQCHWQHIKHDTINIPKSNEFRRSPICVEMRLIDITVVGGRSPSE